MITYSEGLKKAIVQCYVNDTNQYRKDIAKKFDVSRSYVTRLLKQAGFKLPRQPKRKISTDKEQKVLELYYEGVKIDKIGPVLFISESSVRKFLKCNNIELKRKRKAA